MKPDTTTTPLSHRWAPRARPDRMPPLRVRSPRRPRRRGSTARARPGRQTARPWPCGRLGFGVVLVDGAERGERFWWKEAVSEPQWLAQSGRHRACGINPLGLYLDRQSDWEAATHARRRHGHEEHGDAPHGHEETRHQSDRVELGKCRHDAMEGGAGLRGAREGVCVCESVSRAFRWRVDELRYLFVRRTLGMC